MQNEVAPSPEKRRSGEAVARKIGLASRYLRAPHMLRPRKCSRATITNEMDKVKPHTRDALQEERIRRILG
jgi:hypothetical protein